MAKCMNWGTDDCPMVEHGYCCNGDDESCDDYDPWTIEDEKYESENAYCDLPCGPPPMIEDDPEG